MRIFGCRPETEADYHAMAPDLFAAVSNNLVSESGARHVMARTYDILARWVPSMIDPRDAAANTDERRQAEERPWLRDASPSIPAYPLASGKTESRLCSDLNVDLYTLARDFTAQVSITVLAGRDFVKSYPGFTHNLFTMDSGFALMALGLPSWLPIRLMRDALAARTKMVDSLDSFQRRLDSVTSGVADDFTKARCEDVSNVFWERNKVYRARGLAFEDRANYELALLWAMNANTSSFVFWVLLYVYAHPTALENIRREVDQHVRSTHASRNSAEEGYQHLAAAPEVLDFDASALLLRCPWLRAAYLEAFRMASQPTGSRRVLEPLTINLRNPAASATNVAPAERLTIPKGTYLSVPYVVPQFDAQTYPEPYQFRPERFLQPVAPAAEQADANGTGGTKAEWKIRPSTLKPWGEGASICRGRVFAEREVLIMVALVISVWDVEPIERTVNGEWKIPTQVPGTGVAQPGSPMMVTIRKRQSAASTEEAT